MIIDEKLNNLWASACKAGYRGDKQTFKEQRSNFNPPTKAEEEMFRAAKEAGFNGSFKEWKKKMNGLSMG